MGTKMKAGLVGLLLVVAIAALAFSRRPSIVLQVHAEETEACTAQTLGGRYGFTGQGFFTGSNTLPAPIAAFVPAADVGNFVSDGRGNISGSDTLSDGGQIIPRTFTGTYTVNSDCTGSTALVFTPGASSPIDIAIVVDDRGREARALQTTPQGAVFTVLARKIR